MSNQKKDIKDAIIMFADIKNSTEFGQTTPDVYCTLIEEFQKMAKETIDRYCADENLCEDKIYSYGQGDEVMVIIYNIEMKSAAKYALELSVHLKLKWRKNDYIRDKREAFSKLKELPIDLRIGIGDGRVVKFVSPWNNLDTFAGVDINVAKRIEMSAEYAEKTLIVVSEGVKNYYERLSSKNIEFDIPIQLPKSEVKGISERSLWVYPVKKYPDFSRISEEILPEKKTYFDYFDSGYAKGMAGDYEGAISDYTKAIELNPKDVTVYNNRGLAYYSKGDYDKAIDDYNKAIELNPKFAGAYYNRGSAYHHKGKYDEAINDYTKAIELNPKFAVAYNNRGLAYYYKDLHDEAINNYTKAIELNPKLADAYNNRGLAYYSKDDYYEAINDFNKAIELNPKLADAYYNRGSAYEKLGNCTKANNDYKKACELGCEKACSYKCY